MDVTRNEFLARIASMYYDEQKTQQEIAELVGLTRSAISRLLTEARERNIVEINVHYPYRSVPELEKELIKQFGLHSAIVLYRNDKTVEEMVHGLGVLTAEYFSEIVTPNSIIGLSWGTNLYQTIRSVKPMSLPNAEVVQLVGGTGAEKGSIVGPLLAPMLAEKLSCSCRFLNAPLITSSPEICKTLSNEPSIKQTLDRAKNVDIALVGIGALHLDIYNPYRLGYVTKEEVEYMVSCGTVGDICVNHFDIDGSITCKEINARVVGIRIEDLRNIPTVIGVAGDIRKAESILGALRTGLLNVLVTDETAARKILELKKQDQ